MPTSHFRSGVGQVQTDQGSPATTASVAPSSMRRTMKPQPAPIAISETEIVVALLVATVRVCDLCEVAIGILLPTASGPAVRTVRSNQSSGDQTGKHLREEAGPARGLCQPQRTTAPLTHTVSTVEEHAERLPQVSQCSWTSPAMAVHYNRHPGLQVPVSLRANTWANCPIFLITPQSESGKRFLRTSTDRNSKSGEESRAGFARWTASGWGKYPISTNQKLLMHGANSRTGSVRSPPLLDSKTQLP